MKLPKISGSNQLRQYLNIAVFGQRRLLKGEETSPAESPVAVRCLPTRSPFFPEVN